ncbi:MULTISPECIES: ABC transporter permease [unclassified Nocardioides]|uniref:ABC transporter permease n=1 Tax=unclassified Nocardioides TaxID=2615069 RepID=UPI000703AEB3|nr:MULTISPECIES: ABC transporter permease [unclassified Nocardioides]KQP67012.1 peptide ABC transporter permease [Nocardioides sp. Leaf285]KQQ41318.1 peptide ABC transporter permease [Nocardioides sp. Leaf307]
MSLTASSVEQPGDSEFHEPQGDDQAEGRVAVEGRSPAKLAWARFRKDKLSMAAFLVVVLFTVTAIATPILVWIGVLKPQDFNPDLVDLISGGLPIGPAGGVSLSHPLGVEPGTGRDLLSRILLGMTLSMTIAVSGAIITVMIGTVLGIIAGFTGGVVDGVIGRFIDLTLSFPSTLMLLALSGVVVDRMRDIGVPNGPDGAFVNGLYIVLVLSAFGWPPVARLIRGQVLSIREREFVDAARLMGASRRRIYFKEILPNLWAPILVYFTLLMPAYVSAEAALSYLGVGIQAPTPTLGNVLRGALLYASTDPIFFFAPAIFIAAIVISFNLLGDGARDALDPKAGR